MTPTVQLGPTRSRLVAGALDAARVARALTAPALMHPEANPPVCLIKGDGTFPTGLVPRVLDLFTEVRAEGGPHVWQLPDWRSPSLPTLHGLVPRVDQADAWRTLYNQTLKTGTFFHRGVIQAATGTGKTAEAALIAASLTGHVLVVASGNTSKDLSWQLRTDLRAMLGEPIGLIQGDTWEPERVTVATAQTILACGGIARVLDGTPLAALIVDECHHLCAPKWHAALLGSEAPVVVGFSGTPWRDDRPLHQLLVEGFCGPLLAELKPGDAIAQGILPPVHVTYLPVQMPRTGFLPGQGLVYLAGLPWKQRDRRDGYSFTIVDNDGRNRLLAAAAQAAVAAGSQVLVHVQAIRHGIDLASRLQCPFLDGSSADAVRKFTLEQFRTGELRVLVATIAGEGLNFPAVDCVVLAGGQRSPIRLLQNIGRGGRASGDQGRTINVIDTFDLGHPITIRHSRERRRTCVAAGYQVSGAGG